MRSGKLRHRICISRPHARLDSYGEDDPQWSVVAERWASINQLGMRQQSLAQANTITTTATHEIRIRFFGGLLVTDRVKFGTREFRINQIKNVEETNWEQVLIVTEVVA